MIRRLANPLTAALVCFTAGSALADDALAPGVVAPSLHPEDAAVARFVPSLAGDHEFAGLVRAAIAESVRTKLVRRANGTRKEANFLRDRIAEAHAPDVFLGIPYVESRLHAEATSRQCAGGHWQFLPEVAIEYGLAVSACTIAGQEGTWTPGSELAPTKEQRPYLAKTLSVSGDSVASGCLITSCEVDERRDLPRSTAAALHYLEDAGRWPELQGPYVVPLQVMAFNGGVGTVQRFLRAAEPGEPFAGMAQCARGQCAALPRETAMYLPRVVAAAAIVTCNTTTTFEASPDGFGDVELCRSLAAYGLAPDPVPTLASSLRAPLAPADDAIADGETP